MRGLRALACGMTMALAAAPMVVGSVMGSGEASAGPAADGAGATVGPYRVYGALVAGDSVRADAPAVTATATPALRSSLAPVILPGVTPSAQPSSYGDITITARTSMVARGGVASITIHTSPGSSCTITYITASGNVSSADGLQPQVTDGAGNARWSWRILPTATQGFGTVSVNCSDAGVYVAIIVS